MSVVTFQILDIIPRDQVIISESDGVREVMYENESDSDDDEFMSANRKKKVKMQTTMKKELIIHLFGRTAEGKKVRVDVDGFRPSFALRVPLGYNLGEALLSIKTYVNKYGSSFSDEIKWTTEKKKTFYGFTADTYFNYIVISVPSLDLYRRARQLFLNKKNYPGTVNDVKIGKPWTAPPEVSDALLDPMLRFLHLRYIDPCGWVKADAYSYDEDTDTYMCQWEHIGPTKSNMPIAPFKQLFWDIECTSDSGDFPLAKKGFNKLAKEVLGLAIDGAHAVELILSAIPYKGSEPNTGISRLQLKRVAPTRPQLENALLNEALQEVLEDAITKYKKALVDVKTQLVKDVAEALRRSMPSIAIKGDPIIQVGCVLVEGAKVEKHLFAQPDCADIDGIIVHSSATEADMLKAWCKWMREVDPDILIGYNIFGFDEKYIHDRMEELGISHDDNYETFNRLCIDGGEMKLEEKFLSSSALGDNYMYIWNTQGRLQVDLYHYVRRTNGSLTSYKLDAVTQYYLSGKVGSVAIDTDDSSRWILTLKGATKEIKVGRAIVLLDGEGEDICDKLEVVEVIDASKGIFAVRAVDDVEIEEVCAAPKWVIGKDDVSPKDIFRLQKGSAADRAIVGKYCIQDCDLTYDLYRKLETFPNAMAMANVCSVPISYIFTRGQGIKIESLIFREAWRRDQRIPVQGAPNKESQDSYEGAIVLRPEPGVYANVGVCDFASLYPSTIESENISHDSLVWVKDYDNNGKSLGIAWGSEEYDGLEGWRYTDITFDILKPDPMDTRKHPKKIKMGVRVCRYAQYPMGDDLVDRKSTLPQIVQQLLAARKQKRKEAASETDPARINLLDVEQLAYKLTANSLYGQLGSSTFKIRLQHLAASVTSYGRTQIMFAKAAIEKFYGNGRDNRCDARCETKVVYGDSVTGDTPVLIKVNDHIKYVEIQTLIDSNAHKWHGDKDAIIPSNDIYTWTERGWTKIVRVIRHHLNINKKLMRITTGAGYVDVTEDHSLVLANGDAVKPNNVMIGTSLMHSLPSEELKFSSEIMNRKLREAYEWFEINKNISISEEMKKIKKIIELPHPGDDAYVYDFETENHHFAVGPGALVVHNTDSLFVQFNPKNTDTGEDLTGLDARQAVFDLTAEAGHFITQALKPPHDFEFDKAFDPIMIFSKKRYTGHMYESSPTEYVQKSMGIVMKRRDNAPILKIIYGSALRKMLCDKDVIGATETVKQLLTDLVGGKIPWSQLTITKSLRAEYANPLSIAHKVLANRIAARDPGNAPVAGDRIPFMYIRPNDGQLISKLQGDRIELPSYAKEKGLQPDYEMYLENQLSIPISQLFSLVVEQMPGYSPDMLEKRMHKLKGTETQEEIDEYIMSVKEMIAYELIFNDVINKYRNEMKRAVMKSVFGCIPIYNKDLEAEKAAKTNKKAASIGKPLIPAAKPNGGGTQMKLDYMFDKMLVSKKMNK
jgi:DNA polymerase elongation subunit (family B)